jgi:hypothetical protein
MITTIRELDNHVNGMDDPTVEINFDAGKFMGTNLMVEASASSFNKQMFLSLSVGNQSLTGFALTTERCEHLIKLLNLALKFNVKHGG